MSVTGSLLDENARRILDQVIVESALDEHARRIQDQVIVESALDENARRIEEEMILESLQSENARRIAEEVFVESLQSENVLRRPCGSGGAEPRLALPELGIGCWAFGGDEASYWKAQAQRDVDGVVEAACELGMNFFDTAEAYNEGASESSVGAALAALRAARPALAGPSAVVGSKVSPQNTAPAATLRAHCDATLARLQLDVLDLYLVHWPLNPRSLLHFTGDAAAGADAAAPNVTECFVALRELQREGKVRHVGVSNFGVRQLTEALATGVTIAVNQLPYSILSRSIELELVPFCREHGIGIVGYSSLMQGLLTGKYACADDMPAERTRTRHFSGARALSRHGGPGHEAEVFRVVDGLRTLAAEAGVAMSELALAYCLHQPWMTCVLVGARNEEQVRANARAKAVAARLDPAVVAAVEALSRPLRDRLGPCVDMYESEANCRTW